LSERIRDIVKTNIKLGKDPKSLLLTYTKTFFHQLFHYWLALRDAYGRDKADELYQVVTWGGPECGEVMKIVYDGAKMEVKDVESMAKAFSLLFKAAGVPLKLVKSSDDEAILEASFCPNPSYGRCQWDDLEDRTQYHRSDGWLGTVSEFNNYLECIGVKDKYELTVDEALCLGFPVCRFKIRKKES
jgi:hypothetical protein